MRARGRRARANSAWGPRPRGNHTWFKGIVPRRQRGPQGLVAAPTAVALVRAALGAGARACNSTRLVLDVYKRASTAKREGGGGLREFARCGREGGRLGMHESKKLHPGTEGSREGERGVAWRASRQRSTCEHKARTRQPRGQGCQNPTPTSDTREGADVISREGAEASQRDAKWPRGRGHRGTAARLPLLAGSRRQAGENGLLTERRLLLWQAAGGKQRKRPVDRA